MIVRAVGMGLTPFRQEKNSTELSDEVLALTQDCSGWNICSERLVAFGEYAAIIQEIIALAIFFHTITFR